MLGVVVIGVGWGMLDPMRNGMVHAAIASACLGHPGAYVYYSRAAYSRMLHCRVILCYMIVAQRAM